MSPITNTITSVIVRFNNANSQTYNAITDNPINPSFTWSGNQTTGIYQPDVNQIGFTINGNATTLINSVGFKGDGSQLTNITYGNITNAPTIPSIANLYSKFGGTISGNVLIDTGFNISGNGSGLTTLNAGNISSGTLSATRGGTGCTALSSTYFDTSTSTLSLKGLPVIPSFTTPLSIANNVVSLGTVPVAKGGTGCTVLSSDFDTATTAGTLAIASASKSKWTTGTGGIYIDLSKVGINTNAVNANYELYVNGKINATSLYYGGTDIDTKYVKTNGSSTITGSLTISGANNKFNGDGSGLSGITYGCLSLADSSVPYAKLSGTPTIPSVPLEEEESLLP